MIGWLRLPLVRWVIASLVAVHLFAILGFAHRAKANAESALLDLGEQLHRLSRGTEDLQVIINGVSFRMTSGTSALPLPTLLDHFQDQCRNWSTFELPQPNQRLKSSSITVGNPDHDTGLDRHGVLRLEKNDRGIVVCLDTGRRSLAPQRIVESALRFAQTGDLGVLGSIRYFNVRKTAATTAYLSVSTQGTVNVLRMFPNAGDAPGTDPVGIPRPTPSRRKLSISEDKQGLGLTSYGVEKSADLIAYRAELSKLGWQLTNVETDPRSPAFVAQKGTRRALIAPHEADEEFWINIVDFENP